VWGRWRSTPGNREETVNYLVNGVTLNNLVFSSIEFQPSISTVQEFKMDNSTISAEYGQSSGAVVNVATRTGSSQFHGELFEFLRNKALDARNVFNLTCRKPPPFKLRETFGGPIIRSKTFFFISYEGLRQLQDLSLNSVVLSDANRMSISDAAVAKLAVLIPHPNFVDSSGTPRFIGSAPGPVDNDQWGFPALLRSWSATSDPKGPTSSSAATLTNRSKASGHSRPCPHRVQSCRGTPLGNITQVERFAFRVLRARDFLGRTALIG
jgi:hypothetical protein